MAILRKDTEVFMSVTIQPEESIKNEIKPLNEIRPLSEEEQKLCMKAAWRLIPLLGVAYFFNYLDRTSVGYAALQMSAQLGLGPAQFGLGAGIMFFGYCLCEVPSNLAMYRFGARLWLSRIMITWGCVAAMMVFVVGPWSFYSIRLLLGIAEAGFFPGVIYFLSIWFPVQFRTRVLAWFTVATPISFLVGGPLSTSLLQLHGFLGMDGWQWMFLIEGVPACLLGFVALRRLADRPEQANWLTEKEKVTFSRMMQIGGEGPSQSQHFRSVLKDVRVWLLSGITFSYTLGTYGVGIWLPQMLKAEGIETTTIGWIAAIPYFFSTLGLIFWARAVDKSGRGVMHLIAALLLAALALMLSLYLDSLVPALIGVTFALVGTLSAKTIFFTLPGKFLRGQAAAGGIALINALGAFGGFVGPFLMGVAKEMTHSFTAGMMLMGCIIMFAAFLAVILLIIMRPVNLEETQGGVSLGK
ncbi:MFS transporter [Rouxiella badensis]|uniref:MFS transporter n=1 Tax=Rouxiella badensis TaxID=1646377 RepID=UPI00111C7260|nr:MFS transporter [Rouxiella badensis]QOI55702.1 MFS transporter [Rouxiella badensis subsp. acadiensis]